MWGLISRNLGIWIVPRQTSKTVTRLFLEKSFKINALFVLLLIATFAFVNIALQKNINYVNKEHQGSQLEIQNDIENASFTNLTKVKQATVKTNLFKENILRRNNSSTSSVLSVLNIVFLMIVSFVILFLSFSSSSLENIEEKILELEKDNETNKHNLKNQFIDSMKTFLDEHLHSSQISIYQDELNRLKSTLALNEVGSWSWNIKRDKVNIDELSYQLIGLKNKAFVGGYTLFLNLFESNSKRKLKRDIAYAIKSKSSFETICSLKRSILGKKIPKKNFIIRGNVILDGNENIIQIQGLIMETENNSKKCSLQAKFFQQPLAMFAVLDGDFNFEFLNATWTDHAGYSLHELKRHPLFTFIHRQEKKLFINRMQVLKYELDSYIRDQSYRFRLLDGSYLKMTFSASYQKDKYFLVGNLAQDSSSNEKADFNFSFLDALDPEYLQS